ncbi:hypothetical protein BN7_785 [Wickerhamomyces ciferrii]|uniref:RSE1/DDB1/CPSF1 first beta-propeller domain-containing protein n=1 Tax=Wickerhamomyces ciferrii (strain ATCC 14091 / BCRC 22168 / CBS 111 / JCM 3599 / NBRC 0793 / NRRL Y-1031 F-60-10) TaxID=1206466 RepID=K0KJG9_WICCF|nr:uncharacterized protein BN7_785 [Wickerhamomyces ciferrii]CCH41248.1 hypothetical protein BN7_785 [Wickerhamomyces ciferrii]
MISEIKDDDILNGDLLWQQSDQNLFRWCSFDDDSGEDEQFRGEYFVLKQNLTPDPTVENIFKMRYASNKEFKGLEDEVREDDGFKLSSKMLKELKSTNPDSMDMDIDDDLLNEMLKYTGANEPSKTINEDAAIDISDSYEPVLHEVVVFTRAQSIVINNETEFKFPSTIRSAAVLKGSVIDDGKSTDEDTLVISLYSGFALLVRLYEIKGSLQPKIVQWWKTSTMSTASTSVPSLEEVGLKINTHSSGSLIALNAAKNCIRLHPCSQTAHGIQLQTPINVKFDGYLAHSCFLKQDKHAEVPYARLLTLLVTSNRRYLITLYDIRLDNHEIKEYSPQVLTNDFDIPVFVIPFKDSALFVMPTSIYLISPNNIINADYNLFSTKFDKSFPVGYHKPETKIKYDDDEVLISTEDGTIYLVTFRESVLRVELILTIPKVSNFTLEKQGTGYELYYTSSFAKGGHFHLPRLHFDPLDIKAGLHQGEKIENILNWSPLLDLEIIKNKYKNEEVWLAHGNYISQLKKGYYATKELQDTQLKRSYKFYIHSFDEQLYFIFAFLDKTLVFKYEDEQLIDVDDSGLEVLSRTIAVSSLGSICFQVLINAVVVSDFASDLTIRKDFEQEIILADAFASYVAVITENLNTSMNISSNIALYKVSGDVLLVGEEFDLGIDPCFMKFISLESRLFLIVGGSQVLRVFEINGDKMEQRSNISIGITDPHDVIYLGTRLAISSRLGEVFIYNISIDSLHLKADHQLDFKVCHTPVDLSATHDGILLVSKTMWKLDITNEYPLPVVFDENKERNIFQCTALNKTTYAALRDDGFCLIGINNTPQTLLKSMKLPKIPRKMKYISHLRVFAVISESSLFFMSKSNKLNTKLFGKKQSNGLFVDEQPLSLSEWVLPLAEKSFRNLLVGCKTANGGSIKVIQPKFSSEDPDTIEAHEIFTYNTPGPVLAFKQLKDDVVIYSSGCQLFISQYDIEKKKMMDPIQVHSFRSVIIDIDVRENLALISTRDYSFSKFEYTDGILSLKESDYCSRKVMNSLTLSESVTISTDKLFCTITGVENQEDRFKSYVPFVPRVQKCDLKPLWYKDKSHKRFVAYGFAGEIQLYTLLSREIAEPLLNYYKHAVTPQEICSKGLFDIDDSIFVKEKNLNVIDADRLHSDLPKDLKDLINAISY